MRLLRQNAVSRQGLIICSILAALVLSRVAPAASVQSLSPRSTTSSLSARPHRACLDRELTHWATPANALNITPQPFVSAELAPALDPQIPFSTEGHHYNRPPPAV